MGSVMDDQERPWERAEREQRQKQRTDKERIAQLEKAVRKLIEYCDLADHGNNPSCISYATEREDFVAVLQGDR